MKKLILLFGICIFIFTGCTRPTMDILSLMNPPKMSENNENLQKSIDKYLPKSKTFLSQVINSTSSPVVFQDINNDNHNEAFVFYVDHSDKMAKVLILNSNIDTKTGKAKWEKFHEITGEGYDIDTATFEDITNDGKYELIIGWKLDIGDAKGLSVYSFSNNSVNEIYQDSYNNMYITDINGDNCSDIFLLSKNNSTAKVISSFENSVSELCNIKTYITSTGIIKLSADKMNDGTSAIIADIDSPNNFINTKIFTFDPSKLLQIVTGGEFFDDYSIKDVPFYSEDIDLDGHMEFFSNTLFNSFKNNDLNTSYIARAYNYDKLNGVIPKFYFVRNITDGYYIKLPDELSDNVYYIYNKDDKKMDIYDTNNDKIIFTIKAFSVSDYKNDNNYKIITSSNKRDLIYTYKISNEYTNYLKNLDLETTIKHNFVLIKQR